MDNAAKDYARPMSWGLPQQVQLARAGSMNFNHDVRAGEICYRPGPKSWSGNAELPGGLITTYG